MRKNKNYALVVSLIVIPVIIYFYFLKWKNCSIHDDDLFIFKTYSGLNSFSEKVKLSRLGGQCRPVSNFFLFLVIEFFKKNLTDYYLFNVGVQTIITLLFALVVNLFLKSPVRSLFFSLLISLSRFSYYNMTQLFNGGPLEGMAMCFFLLSLLFVLKALIKDDQTQSQKQKRILLGILFANLSLYCHERYIVLPAFIIIILLFFPSIKTLGIKRRASLSIIALFSIILPFFIKKYVYFAPAFLGTGNTNIAFSFSSATSFFIEAVLGIFQINTGPEYLSGIPFSSLPLIDKTFTLLFAISALAILCLYLYNTIKKISVKQETSKSDFSIFIFLPILFVLLLIPAIVTIRLELRWLQAPLSIFLLMIVIALNSFRFKNHNAKKIAYSFFIILSLWTNYTYLNKGAENLYYSLSAKIASVFKQAINDGKIHANTSNLYIWEKQKNADRENEVNWSLAYGYFFDFYQNNSKKMIFTDSVYRKSDNTVVGYFPNFNKNTDEIIFLDIQNDRSTFKYTISNITDDYLKDSLKTFIASHKDE